MDPKHSVIKGLPCTLLVCSSDWTTVTMLNFFKNYACFWGTCFAISSSRYKSPNILVPGPVAQSDAYPPGIQMVADSILWSGKAFFSGDWSRNPFYNHSLPTTDSSRAIVSYWWKDVH